MTSEPELVKGELCVNCKEDERKRFCIYCPMCCELSGEHKEKGRNQ